MNRFPRRLAGCVARPWYVSDRSRAGPQPRGKHRDDDRRTCTMLIGHYAPALVLQRARPSVKLWQLFVATQLVDVLWAAFVFGGIEHARIVPGFTESNDLDLWDMPYTHSLVGTVAWAALAFVAWWFVRREPTRTVTRSSSAPRWRRTSSPISLCTCAICR
jgi:hypothetical protein